MYNSRIENGKPYQKSENICCGLQTDELNEEIEDFHLNEYEYSYSAESDDFDLKEFHYYLPEKETINTLKKRVVFDKEVKDYIDIDRTIDFIYSCVDINAIACTRCIAFLWNKTNKDDEYIMTPARKKLGLLTDAYDKDCGLLDEYLEEVGVDEHLLGINWNERSAVIINMDVVVETAKDFADNALLDWGIESEDAFPECFKRVFLSTLLHELRHSVYLNNQFIEFDDFYPKNGNDENYVEQYGHNAMVDILNDIDNIYQDKGHLVLSDVYQLVLKATKDKYNEPVGDIYSRYDEKKDIEDYDYNER